MSDLHTTLSTHCWVQIPTQLKSIYWAMLFSLLLTGCGANPKKEIFNPENPTMESILLGNDASVSTYSYRAHSRDEAVAHNGTVNPNQILFRELDNPTLFLYIEPHVTAQQTYIPGMTVPLKRYREVEFALPGEL